jgi:formate/nitrite transporter FocA (FNT family)
LTDAGDSPLNQDERDEVRERSNPPALILHEAIRLEGQEELKRSTSSLLWSGLAAGLSMGFSMVGEIGWGRYAFGFLLPSLIGNVLDGVGLVALINHAQVREDR